MKTVVSCDFCGDAFSVEYIDYQTHVAARKAVLAHEQRCPANPLVQRLAETERLLRSLAGDVVTMYEMAATPDKLSVVRRMLEMRHRANTILILHSPVPQAATVDRISNSDNSSPSSEARLAAADDRDVRRGFFDPGGQ